MKKIYSVFIMVLMAIFMASSTYGDVTELKKNVFNAEQVFKHGITVSDYITLDGQDVINPVGKVWYVKSTGGADTLGNNTGKSRTRPFATVDYAINQSASGDIIAVLAGHAESFSAADGFDADVAGITIIGLGTDTEMPEFTFADTDATIAVGAAGVRIVNLMIRAGISEVVTGISIEAGGDGAVLDGLYFVQPGTSTFEFDKAIVLASGADRVTIQNCTSYRTAATGATSWLDVTTGVVNQLKVLNNIVYGEYSVAPIYSDQINIDATIMDNVVQNLTTGQFAIEFSGATTGTYGGNMVYTDGATTAIDPGSMKAVKPNWIVTAVDKSPVMFPAQDDTAENFIGVDDNNNLAATTNVASNRDGSILERLEFINKYLETGTAGGLTAPANTYSILDILGTDGSTTTGAVAGSLLGAIGTNEATANTPFTSSTVAADADGSVLERLEVADLYAGFGPGYNHPNYLAVSTGTFDTTGTWSTATSHEIATVTGAVRMIIIPECTASVSSVSDTGTIALGDETTGNSIIAASTLGSGVMVTGELWVDATLTRTILTKTQLNALEIVVANGKDIGYTVATNALSGGSMTFHIWWIPINATGAVAAGAGGTL